MDMGAQSSDQEAQRPTTKIMPRIPGEVLMDVVSCLTRYDVSECHLVSSGFHQFLDDVQDKLPLNRLSYVSVYPGSAGNRVEVKICPCGRKLQREFPEAEASFILNRAIRFSFVREMEVNGATLTHALCEGIADAISTVTVGNLSFYPPPRAIAVDSRTFQDFLLGFSRITNLLRLSSPFNRSNGVGTYRSADIDDDFMRRCVQKGIHRIQCVNADVDNGGPFDLTYDGLAAFCFEESPLGTPRWLELTDARHVRCTQRLLDRLVEAHRASPTTHEVCLVVRYCQQALNAAQHAEHTNEFGMRLKIEFSDDTFRLTRQKVQPAQ
ncbi:hypothetical protein AAVH_31874 [Aphelenchoides avenae]|nr:hypothetical protein AAVH_31874 [Aphelenchus avenae]